MSEGSIGANLRRIEAVTGEGALDRVHDEEVRLRTAAGLLNVGPAEVPDRIERLLAQVKTLGEEINGLRSKQAVSDAGDLVAEASNGVIAVRRDGVAGDDLRRITLAARDALGSGVVAIVGASPDGKKAAIAVAVSKDLVEQGRVGGRDRRTGREGARRGNGQEPGLRARVAARTSPRLDDAARPGPGTGRGSRRLLSCVPRILGVDLGSSPDRPRPLRSFRHARVALRGARALR